MAGLLSENGFEGDAAWMEMALQEGARGLGKTSPNPPVGAVLVHNGRAIGCGWHRKAGQPHAEVEALRDAREDPRGATLYVTLEPCSTTGRTPPCVEAIVAAGIARVVFGMVDPNPAHAGKGLEQLRQAGVQVSGPVLGDRAAELIRFFARWIVTGRPYVIAKSGMTLDGRITPCGGAGWITGEEARDDVQRLRSEIDAILVGGETVRVDNPRLTLRGAHAAGREQPLRVVVTRSGDLPPTARIFTDEHRQRTRVFHVEHLEEVLDTLGQSGVCSVLLECGGRLMGEAFRRDLVDEVCFYVAPTIGGGMRRAVEVEGFEIALGEMEVSRFGPDLRIRAKTKRKS